ncbi:hypothetical protein [Rhodocista pekingensis]|uniref:Uncharacterized protein n=1 Tax=Rhodocista pekingensis TaxID=201185 RepID=A0ABW2KU83_9PROT
MPPDPKADLLRQMRDLRRRIDPAVLEKAAGAARTLETARTAPRAPGPAAQDPAAAEPYDKQAARQAVMLFLQGRADNGQFARRLMDALQKPEEAAKAYRKPETAAPKPTVIRRTRG